MDWLYRLARFVSVFKERSTRSCCIGYLDHPFKNKPVETEKDHLRLFANIGRLV
jgi:hypothetical protein